MPLIDRNLYIWFCAKRIQCNSPCGLTDTCLQWVCSALWPSPALAVWAPVCAACSVVSHLVSPVSVALSPAETFKMIWQPLCYDRMDEWTDTLKERWEERRKREWLNDKRSCITHLSFLPGLDRLHQHHMLPMSLPLLQQQTSDIRDRTERRKETKLHTKEHTRGEHMSKLTNKELYK